MHNKSRLPKGSRFAYYGSQKGNWLMPLKRHVRKEYSKNMSILFINGSPNKEGNTARLAEKLLAGKEYKSLHLVDYRLYSYGQKFEDDQFAEIVDYI